MKWIFCLICIITLIALAGCNQSAQVTYSTGGDAESWCMAGSNWQMGGAQAGANMVIKGIATSGKYAGYCHVTYDITSAQGDAHVDYYFNKEGAGYQVAEVNGQRIETEWNS